MNHAFEPNHASGFCLQQFVMILLLEWFHPEWRTALDGATSMALHHLFHHSCIWTCHLNLYSWKLQLTSRFWSSLMKQRIPTCLDFWGFDVCLKIWCTLIDARYVDFNRSRAWRCVHWFQVKYLTFLNARSSLLAARSCELSSFSWLLSLIQNPCLIRSNLDFTIFVALSRVSMAFVWFRVLNYQSVFCYEHPLRALRFYWSL